MLGYSARHYFAPFHWPAFWPFIRPAGPPLQDNLWDKNIQDLGRLLHLDFDLAQRDFRWMTYRWSRRWYDFFIVFPNSCMELAEHGARNS